MLKTKVILVSVIFLVAGILFFTGRTEIKNTDSKGENIICFGDSLTFGYGVKPQEDYPSILKKMVQMPVINAGVDGDTSFDALKRIKKDVLDNRPFLVLIEFCGNDFLKGVPEDKTVENIREIILQVQQAKAIAVIVDISAGMFLKNYRYRLSKLAKETGAVFVPGVLSGIITNPCMKSDFLHPNSQGYVIIAERVYRRIKPYLK